MLYIKYFSKKLVIFSDGEKDYTLKTDQGEFDRDILEDILGGIK